MERTFTHGKWIWHNGEAGNDEYTEFTDSFVWESGVVTVRISVSGDYTLFINGKYAASNQYGDFEYYKVYDEIDITKFLKRGKNTIAAIGWYWGRAGMRWNTPEPGMIYEVENDGKILCASTAATLCRKSKAYLSGRETARERISGNAGSLSAAQNYIKDLLKSIYSASRRRAKSEKYKAGI